MSTSVLKVLLPFLTLLCLGTASADLIRMPRESLPAEVPQSAFDSILTTVFEPKPTYPEAAVKARVTGVVWFRLSVGEGGTAKDIDLLHCDAPGYGLEDEATRAIKAARFKPAWDGIYPRLAWGYYPVTFADPKDWKRPAIRTPHDIIGLGLDAPIVTPIDAPDPVYPDHLAGVLVEPDVILRLLVNKKGMISNVRALNCSVQGLGFEDAAEDYARSLSYPKKKRPRRTEYSAYLVVRYRLSDKQLLGRGLPLPTDNDQFDTPPELVWHAAKEIPFEAFQRNLSGTVSLTSLVDSTGRVLTVRLAESSGHAILDSAATFDAYRRKYTAATKGGVPVAAWHQFAVPYLDYERQTNETYTSPPPPDFPDPNTDERIAELRPSAYPDVEVPDVQPKFVAYEKSKYPPGLEEAGIEGTVKVAALIDKDASVIDIRLVRGSGYDEFDSAAMAAIPFHQYEPGKTDDQPVASWTSWVVRFRKGSKDVVFNDTTRVVIKPQIVEMRDPEYPDNARRAGIEGTVWLLLYVDTTGAVAESEILQTSGTTALDLAALDVAPFHKFTPALVDGIRQNFWLRYRVDFAIEEASPDTRTSGSN